MRHCNPAYRWTPTMLGCFCQGITCNKFTECVGSVKAMLTSHESSSADRYLLLQPRAWLPFLNSIFLDAQCQVCIDTDLITLHRSPDHTANTFMKHFHECQYLCHHLLNFDKGIINRCHGTAPKQIKPLTVFSPWCAAFDFWLWDWALVPVFCPWHFPLLLIACEESKGHVRHPQPVTMKLYWTFTTLVSSPCLTLQWMLQHLALLTKALQ